MKSSKYETSLQLIDEGHSQDPNKITVNGQERPYELHYAEKMTKYLLERCPNPSEELHLAIRAQHFRRWEVPRASYPMTRPGYYAWRTFLKKRQAELVASICSQSGYSVPQVERISSMIRKENMKEDEETQVLEDVACIVFLDDQFEAFEKEHDEEKIIKILQKTWSKMSDKGHELAMGIPMSDRAKSLIEKALAPPLSASSNPSHAG